MKKVKKFFADFKAFVSKGNVIDLAVAVIIGAAFGKIVSSLVNDIIMPLVTGAIGKNSLSELVWTLREAVVVNGETVKEALTVNWGSFLQNIVDFLIIAFVVFLFVRVLTAAKNVAGKLSDNAKDLVVKVVKHDKSAETETEVTETAVAAPEIPDIIPDSSVSDDQWKRIETLLTEIRDSIKK